MASGTQKIYAAVKSNLLPTEDLRTFGKLVTSFGHILTERYGIW